MKSWALILLPFIVFLQSCASSDITREATDNIDVGYQNAGTTFGSLGNGSIADTYQNSSQQAKGVVIGGTAGAVVGGVSSGVGAIAGLATGAILGGAYGAYIDAHTSILDQLENRGVKVIVLGDQVLLVLPSYHVFNAMTPVIQPGAYTTLDLVAKYINSYTSMMVKVTAHTNESTPKVDLALSKEQAESVVRYLWQRGVNTRMLTAEGDGGAHLVTANNSDWEKSENYRLEITMEKLPV